MKIILLLLTFTLCNSIFSQNYKPDYTSRNNEIMRHIQKDEFYDAIKKMDVFLLSYPEDARMFFNRGLAELYMNDYFAAKQDMLKAKELGFSEHRDVINFVTSKSYLVRLLTKSYMDFDSLNPENGFKPDYSLKDSLQGSLRPERTCFDVHYYNLTVKINPKTKSIEGSNQIYFITKEITSKIQIDLSDNFTILSIDWKGKELKYNRLFNAVFISFDEPLRANESHLLTIGYAGKPRVAPSPPWNGGFVWKKERFNYWTGVACEHLGASSWWPCKDHLSEKPDSMSINIQVPTGYEAIANGNLRSTNKLINGYTNFEWFVSYPINSYCVTFYMGKFVNFHEFFSNANGSYRIDYYVLPSHLKKARKYYSKTKDILEVYEKLFGEYPYKRDGVAMVEAPFEGMEHQSAIAIGGGYGKKDRRNYENKDYDYLLVHETAHEWWGNTVTMGDMADAWISEGFATFAEHLFIEEMFGYEEYVSASADNMLDIFNIWPMVGKRGVNDNSFLSGDIYHKGAAMLNNLRCTINDDSLFFSIVKNFYEKYKFKIVTSSDFTNYVNERTCGDYTDFFNKFLYDTIPPVLKYKFSLVDDTLRFKYRWIHVGKNFTMPFSIAINNEKNYRLNGTTEFQTFILGNVKSFYLPNEKRFKKDQITKNSFTYYWTSW